MRPAYLFSLLSLLVFAGSCEDKVPVFYKQTDIAIEELNGKVKSIAKYHYSFDSFDNYRSVWRMKYDERGFLTEKTDTTMSYFLSYKYFYDEHGLLAKIVFTSDAFPSWDESYSYSFSDRKRTNIFRQNISGIISIDTIISLYDENGNELQNTRKTTKSFNEYDNHGFLVSEKYIFQSKPQDTSETHYINDAAGHPLKVTRSDGTQQTLVYNKDGKLIQQSTLYKPGEVTDWFIGYCEMDKYGNYLKKISFCPQTKAMAVDSQVIEYY